VANASGAEDCAETIWSECTRNGSVVRVADRGESVESVAIVSRLLSRHYVGVYGGVRAFVRLAQARPAAVLRATTILLKARAALRRGGEPMFSE
jgi:hypothetical protein